MTPIRGRLCLSTLVLAMFASGAATGNPKLDAHLLVAQAEQQRISALKPAERIKAAAAVADLEVLIRFEGDGVAKIRAAGGIVRSVLGNIASVTLPGSALAAVAALPEVIYLEVPPPPVKRLNVSVPATRASLLRTGTAPNWTGNVGTGAGVIVGIIDDGIAFRHQDFRNPDGTTRIIELWDQRATGAAGTPPAGYTAGGVCTSAMIDAAIAGNAASCTQPSVGNHGTHVGGIAAGNGQATGNGQAAYRFVGMAPNADILAANSIGAGVASGAELLDAVTWMKARAAALGKPLVINLSLGSYFGSRDGTSNFETALTNASGAGVIVTGAAGNEGGAKIRAIGTLSQGETKTVSFNWRAGLTGSQRMEMWYPGAHVYEVKVTGPGGNCGTNVFVGPGAPQTFTLACGELVVVSTGQQALNDDRQILVNFNPSAGNPTGFVGNWTIDVKGTTVGAANTPFSIICGEDAGGLLFTSDTEAGAVTRAILTNASTANRVIAVGAYNTNYNWVIAGGGPNNPSSAGPLNDVSNFSSRGPRRDCSNLTKCPRVMKPSITAPGAVIMAALGADAPNPGTNTVEQDGVHVAYNGTSMATPHVTGAIALMLQKNSALTPEQALRLLAITRQTNPFTTNLPTYSDATPLLPTVENDHWGYGIMDAKAAVDAITQTIIGFNPTTPVTAGTTPATLTATGGLSGSPIVFGTTSANTVCTVAGSTVTFAGAGTCALTANQAAGGGALAAVQVAANIFINAAPVLPQTVVSFAAQTPAFQPLIIGSTFPVNPMAVAGASAAAVVYSAAPSAVCAVAGSTVTMAGVGNCAVTANQAGDATHSAATPVTQTVEVVATLDVDRAQPATQYHATTDGMLVMRYLLGLQGSALTAGALGDSPARGDPVAVKAYLDAIRSKLDIDGDSTYDAATDGVLILRYLLGFRGAALINGAIATAPRTPTRVLATDIEIYIRSLMR